jgi:hypothetical protein
VISTNAPYLRPSDYSQATRPATATTAAARLPTACWAPGAAAPVAPALALPVAVENVADAEPVACTPDAVMPKPDGTAVPVADVTMVLVQEQEES